MPPADRLGCAETYRAAIHFQGGASLWTWIEGLTALQWGRKRDDYSEATVTVAKTLAGSTCCGRLGQTRTWGHELTIYRDDDPNPVWQGPIIRKTEKRATISFDARDVLFWLDRRAVAPAGPEYFWPTPTDTGAILRQLINDGFPVGDPARNPGITQYAVLEDTGTRSTTDHLWRDSEPIGSVMRDLIGAGVDVFTVGRRIYIVSDTPTGRAYRLTDRDFLDELELRENGLDAATRGVLVGGQPLDGNGQPIQDVAPVIGRSGGPEPFFGQIDRLSTSQNTNNQQVADGIAGAMRSYGTPPPIDLVVPDNARLSPDAPVTLGQLIPGRPFTVLLDGYCTRIQQDFRLNELEVTWSSTEVEQVAVSLASNGPVRQAGAA